MLKVSELGLGTPRTWVQGSSLDAGAASFPPCRRQPAAKLSQHLLPSWLFTKTLEPRF